MQSLNLTTLFVLAFGISAQAGQGVTNDLPSVVFSCRESQNGALVLDGAKTITLSRDQFGQAYLTVVQKDQFNGNSILIENLPLKQNFCRGYLPCELYEADQGSTYLFVNYLSNLKPLEGYLESSVTGSIEFICQK